MCPSRVRRWLSRECAIMSRAAPRSPGLRSPPCAMAASASIARRKCDSSRASSETEPSAPPGPEAPSASRGAPLTLELPPAAARRRTSPRRDRASMPRRALVRITLCRRSCHSRRNSSEPGATMKVRASVVSSMLQGGTPAAPGCDGSTSITVQRGGVAHETPHCTPGAAAAGVRTCVQINAPTLSLHCLILVVRQN